MLGEQFMVGEEICGAVVSVRFQVSSIFCFVPEGLDDNNSGCGFLFEPAAR